MRLCLIIDPDDYRSGYVNLAPERTAAGVNLPYFQGSLSDLSHIADAGEVEELVALGVLDTFPADRADDALRNWLSRLAHGGSITLSVVDIKEVARGVLTGAITVEEANDLLYGTERLPRRSALALGILTEVLTNLGYDVVSKRLQNYRAVVTAVRP